MKLYKYQEEILDQIRNAENPFELLSQMTQGNCKTVIIDAYIKELRENNDRLKDVLRLVERSLSRFDQDAVGALRLKIRKEILYPKPMSFIHTQMFGRSRRNHEDFQVEIYDGDNGYNFSRYKTED
jgi:hypothetical protein